MNGDGKPVEPNNRYVITGCPGSGKTSLITALHTLGYTCHPEIARNLINSGITPQKQPGEPNPGRFLSIILQERIRCHQGIKGAETGFFDRGIPDSAGYLKFQGNRIPDNLREVMEMYRYNEMVFVAPPWKEIYTKDFIRTETFDEACQLGDLIKEAYEQAGYRIIELPMTGITERIDFIVRLTGQQP